MREARWRLSEALLSFAGLACRRGDRLLWRGLTGGLHAGEAIHVVGSNGIGKSSLMRIIAGLLPAALGEIDRPARTAMVDEALALDRDCSVVDALGFWAGIDGDGPEAVVAALDAVALTSLADVPVRFLSTGQRKRAALARVIAADAQLWLLDEPGNGLDRDGLTMLEGLIARHRAGGGAVLIASHLPLALPDAQLLDLAAYRPDPSAMRDVEDWA